MVAPGLEFFGGESEFLCAGELVVSERKLEKGVVGDAAKEGKVDGIVRRLDCVQEPQSLRWLTLFDESKT